MEKWFWVLGWFLSILTMVVNGFVIFLVCRKRQLRTKTNTFIVSLAVADFGVGMLAVPSHFFCSLTTDCTPRSKEGLIVTFVRVFTIYASGTNLVSLVLERYVAVVKPLKYLTFMKRRRVIQMVLTSWGIPFLFILTLVSLIKLCAIDRCGTIRSYLYLLFEIILCVILIFFTASMFLVVYNLKSRDRTLTKQLRFNQLVTRVKTQNTSAVKWVAMITCVFLSCYGIMMRCSLLVLTGQSINDFHYKIPLQVINSGINPIVYAFFKRDIHQECKRLLFKRRRYLTTEWFRRKKNIS